MIFHTPNHHLLTFGEPGFFLGILIILSLGYKQSYRVYYLLQASYTVVKVDGATPRGLVRDHDKPIHGGCAIYFPGGVIGKFGQFLQYFGGLVGQSLASWW